MKYTALDWIAYILVIIGAINWGLVGAFDFNLVTEIFGETNALADIIFILVGIAGIYLLYSVSMHAYEHSPNDTV